MTHTDGGSHDDWRSRRAIAIEIGGYLICLSVCVELALRLAQSITSGASLRLAVVLLAASGIGMLLADFLVGFTHFLADTVGDERTPVFGPTLIRTFREHHAAPTQIVQHGLIETNAAAGLGLLPVLLLGRAGLCIAPSAFGYALMAVFGGSVLIANQVHKWAHCAAPPRWVSLLQRSRVILNPADHAVHHRSPHDTRYCIVFGWLNGPLDRLHFFAHTSTLIDWLRRRIRLTARAVGGR